MTTEISSDQKTTSLRIAEVLKSSLERHLTTSENAVRVAGHGSHVVSDKLNTSIAPSEEGSMVAGWDDQKYKEFALRLSKLQDASTV